MWHAIEHALVDTLTVFIIVFILYFFLSFVESKLADKFLKSGKYSPIIGATFGLIPQCGFSIVAADLYKKKYISVGTLIAVFIACSDEALVIMLSSPDKILSILPMFAIKFVFAIAFGYLIDLIIKRQTIRKHNHNEHSLVHKGCCHHEIGENKETFAKKHLFHPLIHSLKICLYVLIINIIFGLLIYYIKEENIREFLNSNIYLTPLFSSIIGLIPNCAISVIISEMYISNILPFSATLAGLISNAGLGLIYLFKGKQNIKNCILITITLFIIAILLGYSSLFIELLISN